TIGLALIIMGLFPFVERRLGYEKSISRKYGYVVLAVGVVKLLGGFADLNSAIVNLYSPIFYQLNEIISIMVVIALLYVIIAITRESVTVIYEKDHNKESEDHQMNQKK